MSKTALLALALLLGLCSVAMTHGGASIGWCDPRANDAKGDGATDDDAAFVACLAALTTLTPRPGGIIFVPPGRYCLKSGAFNAALAGTTVAIEIVGAGITVSQLDVCGVDVDLIRLNGNFSVIRDIQLLGAVFPASNHHALTFTANCVECKAQNVRSSRGYFGVLVEAGAADVVLDTVTVASGYGTAQIEVLGQAFLRRVKDDGPPLPGGVPAYGTSILAWSAGASVTTGQIVTTDFGGRNYAIQYTANGTTGTSAPVLQPYNVDIVDGTTVGRLLGQSGKYLLEFNSPAILQANMVDLTGFSAAGIRVAGGGIVVLVNSTIAGSVNENILIDSASSVSLVGVIFQGCVAAGCSKIKVSGSTNVLITDGVVIGVTP